MDLLLWALVVSVGLNLLMFLPAYLLKTDKLTDISYSLTFIIVALYAYSLSQMDMEQLVLFLMVLAWAFRLGGFLFIRINKVGKDSRFDEMRSKAWSFGRFWFFQGLTVFIVLLPCLLFFKAKLTDVNTLSKLGVVIFATGLIIEALADWQKFRFRNNGGQKWIDSGLWKISRHPNYLGEIMVWSGIYLYTFSSLGSDGKLIGLISPLYIAGILLFFSGVPLLEKAAAKKWGHDKDYKNYKNEVPILIPSLRSLSRLSKK